MSGASTLPGAVLERETSGIVRTGRPAGGVHVRQELLKFLVGLPDGGHQVLRVLQGPDVLSAGQSIRAQRLPEPEDMIFLAFTARPARPIQRDHLPALTLPGASRSVTEPGSCTRLERRTSSPVSWDLDRCAGCPVPGRAAGPPGIPLDQRRPEASFHEPRRFWTSDPGCDWCEGIGLSGSYELPCGESQGRALPEDSVMHPWEHCQNQPGLGHTRTAAIPGLASPRPWRWGTPGERRITGAPRAC
jgi:hypothetical protein